MAGVRTKMTRVRTNVNYSDGKGELANFKALKHGGLDDELWTDETELIDYRRIKSKKQKKKRGCPENDYKEHVYIWQTEDRIRTSWSGKPIVWSVDVRVCCGCGKVSNRKFNW